MESKPNGETKTNSFQIYLEKVAQHIAGGVGPENFKEIAPKLSKHYDFVICCNSIESNVTREMCRCIGKVFSEMDLSKKIMMLDEMSKLDSTETKCRSPTSSDPKIIRQHWLNHRKEVLKSKLKESRQQTAAICVQIKRKRAIMEQHINGMEKIQNTHFKKILL